MLENLKSVLNWAQAKRVETLLDEVRDAESVVFTYRKDLKEMGMRLKQQHNLYQVNQSSTWTVVSLGD